MLPPKAPGKDLFQASLPAVGLWQHNCSRHNLHMPYNGFTLCIMAHSRTTDKHSFLSKHQPPNLFPLSTLKPRQKPAEQCDSHESQGTQNVRSTFYYSMRGMRRKLVSYVYPLNTIIKFILFDSIRIKRYYYPWLRKSIITNLVFRKY